MTNIRGMRRPSFVVTAAGLNGTGGVPIGGVLKGDIIENVRNIVTGASAASSFETTATVNGEIQQSSSSNLSGNEFDFIVTPVGVNT